MAKTRLSTVQDLEDLVRGFMIYATGGGGSPEKGLKFLKETLEETGYIDIIDPEDLSDNAIVCTCFYMGSVAPRTQEVIEKLKERGLAEKKYDRVLPEAVLALERLLGKKVEAIVPVEIGGLNTAAPIDTAARTGKYIINGDYAGRAVPELPQITPSIYEKTPYPMSSVDEYGNTVFIEKTVNTVCAEYLGKQISTLALGLVGQTSYTMTAKEMKEIIIPGTLTKCLEVGRAIREAKENGEDPVKVAVEKTNGWLLFKGEVLKKEWKDEAGYLWGTTYIKGLEEFEGQNMKIWFKNENHITWLNDEVYVTSPDIISVLYSNTGEGTTNTDLKKGDLVSVIGIAHEKYRNDKALRVLEPKWFGFDYDYRPIESVVK